MQAEPSFDLSKGEAVEFSVRNEPWVKYKLENGTSLYGRLVVTKIYKTGQYGPGGQPVYVWTSQNFFSTFSPTNQKGEPSNPPPLSTNPNDYNTTLVDFERTEPEAWNIYNLSDGVLLRMKLELVSILKTDRFSFDGEPFYIINSQVISRTKVPPKL